MSYKTNIKVPYVKDSSVRLYRKKVTFDITFMLLKPKTLKETNTNQRNFCKLYSLKKNIFSFNKFTFI